MMDILPIKEVRNDLIDLVQEMLLFVHITNIKAIDEPIHNLIKRINGHIKTLDAFIKAESKNREEEKEEEGKRKFGIFWRLIKRL